jgi:hypothetical protein
MCASVQDTKWLSVSLNWHLGNSPLCTQLDKFYVHPIRKVPHAPCIKDLFGCIT